MYALSRVWKQLISSLKAELNTRPSPTALPTTCTCTCTCTNYTKTQLRTCIAITSPSPIIIPYSFILKSSWLNSRDEHFSCFFQRPRVGIYRLSKSKADSDTTFEWKVSLNAIVFGVTNCNNYYYWDLLAKEGRGRDIL